jgi:hypothetical protein
MDKLLITSIMLAVMGSLQSQPLTGVKNIPADYATVQLAISALNTQGVGTNGVIFNIDANHVETLANSTAGVITASGTATDSIVFRKNPTTTGNNPKVISFLIATSSATDGIMKIAGGDYITFDGITLEENPSNTAATKLTEWGFALVKKQNTTPFDGCQHVRIRNCTITLNKTNVNSVGIYSGNHIATSVSQLGIQAKTDACNNSLFENNTISNVYTGVSLNGFNASAPYSLYDHNNRVGWSGKNRIYNFGGSSSGVYGVYANYQDSIKVINDSISGGAGTTSIVAGIFLQTASGASAEIAGNYISVTRSTANGNNLYGIWNQFGGIPSQNCIKIHDNIIKNCNQPVTTTGNIYGILNNGGADTVRIFNNEVAGSSYSGTASHFGIRSDASGGTQFINNNLIHNLTNSITGGMTLIYTASFATSNCFDNDLHDCSGNGGTVYGMYVTTTPTWNVYGNSLNNLVSNNGSTAACVVNGIFNQGAATANIYNNMVAGLNANAATNNPSVFGIYIAGGTTSNIYYNTVYLNASSTGTTFGTAALYTSTTPSIVLRNNILVNISSHGTTGYTVAYRRSGTPLANYSSASNNNCFYAGVPGPNNFIFYNGTSGDQTITDFKTRVSPRDALSFSENPPFIQVATPPYDVHLSPSTPSLCESGAATITTPAITGDFDDQPRYPNAGYPASPFPYTASAPDVGADEFGGIPNDVNPPVISYFPLENTSSFGPRALVASITDLQSGIPSSLPGLPVLYWKINNAATWSSAVGSLTGIDQYTFTFGSGVVLADVVYYFVCAQDGFLIPNVAVNPAGGADGLSSNPPACSTPPSPTYGYRIVGTLPAGNYLIGGTGSTPAPGCTYVDITEAFADVNNVIRRIDVTSGGGGYTYASVSVEGGGGLGATAYANLSGDMVESVMLTYSGDYYLFPPDVIITGDGSGAQATAILGAGKEVTGAVNLILDGAYLPSEEEVYPIRLNSVVGTGPLNAITLKPGPGTAHVISAPTNSSVMKLNGVDYFTLDGSNNGSSSKDLTLSYLASGINTAVLWIASATEINGATHNTIKNCVIRGSGPSTYTYAGIFSGGPVSIENNFYALSPNSYNTIENNSICWARNGIVCLGQSTATWEEGLRIINNQLGNESAGEGFTNQGIVIENQTAGFITGNHIRNIIYNNQFHWVTGIHVLNSKSMNISANTIHGLRQAMPGASYWVDGIYQSSPAYNTAGNPSENVYANNVIYDLTSNGESSYYNVIGIHNVNGWGDKYYFNSVYLSGQLNQSGSSNGSMSACFSNGQGVNAANTSNIDLMNNIFYMNSNNPSGVNHHYAHYATLNTYSGSTLDYNLLHFLVSGTAIGHTGFFSSTNQNDIGQWQAATLQDLASLAVDPLFTSSTNLAPQAGSPVLAAGTPVAGITTDFNGLLRDISHPSLGAFETVYQAVKTWNGSVSTDWTDGANWTPSGIPAATDNLIFPSATLYSCSGGTSGLICSSILINNGATLSFTNGSDIIVHGNLTIQPGGTLSNNGILTLKGDLVNQN